MRSDWGAMLLVAAISVQDEPQGYEYQEAAVIEAALEEVMSRPEFHRLSSAPEEEDAQETPMWLERLADWLEELFGGANVPDGASQPGVGLAELVYAVAAVIVIAVIVLISRAIFVSSTERDLQKEREDAAIVHTGAAPGETAPEEFWTRAQALASEGRFKPAIRELLLGAMSAIERRGLIRHRKGLTNRDYFWAARGGMRASLQTIITMFELVYFGRREATKEGFRECATAYRKSFTSHGSVEEAT